VSKDPERKWTPTPAPVPKSKPPGPRAGGEDQGRPLESGARRELEAKLGEDFSGVRVHSGPGAAESAQGIGARAYAVGEDIAFGAGELAPDTPRGARLLEHELGHVVEQRHGAPLGVYRAPQGETEIAAEPARTPHPKLDPALGGLSLGLSTLDDFDLNEATLKPKHRAAIVEVAQKLTMLLTRMPAGHITVTGHTDALGGEDVNLKVGRRRAEAVAAALEKEGVPAGAVRVVSEGKHEPVVATKGAEPRNRRVEVRFQGELVTPEAGPGLVGPLGADRPTKVDLTPHPPLGTPSQVPPLLQPGPILKPPGPVVQPPLTGPTPPERDQPTRPGKGGDLLKAALATQKGKRLVELAKAEAAKIPVGGKLAIGVLAASAAIGISTDPAARKTVLDTIDGAEVEVPGAPWLKLKAHTKGGGIGAGIQIDVIKLFGGGK
jgi:outer membrane protein OmpA-like peptidoglycan-associated protein